MPRVCSICTHAQRADIDKALASGQVPAAVSALFRVSEDAVTRHKARHLPAALAKAQDAHEVATADGLLRELLALRDRAYTLLETAESAGDVRTALMGIREARECLALMGRIAGELKDAPTVQVAVVTSPEWVAIRSAMMDALRPYPDAQQAVSAALLRLDA